MLVTGELKSNPIEDGQDPAWLDVATYAREIFHTQDRRFVLGFGSCRDRYLEVRAHSKNAKPKPEPLRQSVREEVRAYSSHPWARPQAIPLSPHRPLPTQHKDPNARSRHSKIDLRVRSKQEFTEPSNQFPAAPGGFPSEAVPYPNLSISPKPDAADINDGKSTVSQSEHWVEGQQESLNTLISDLKTQVGPNKEQLNAMMGELEEMRRGKARETQGEKIRDHGGNLTAPLPPIRGMSPSSQEPKYNLAGDENPLGHPQTPIQTSYVSCVNVTPQIRTQRRCQMFHFQVMCSHLLWPNLPPIRGHLNQQAEFTAEFNLRESTALEILNIIKFTIGDARKNCYRSEYIKSIARYGRDASLTVELQLMWAWMNSAPSFQGDVA
ncbi:MAG: hypothetical protein Q9178_007893 [Gyalolechia marmorata]